MPMRSKFTSLPAAQDATLFEVAADGGPGAAVRVDTEYSTNDFVATTPAGCSSSLSCDSVVPQYQVKTWYAFSTVSCEPEAPLAGELTMRCVERSVLLWVAAWVETSLEG
jgi:hypothetical protein